MIQVSVPIYRDVPSELLPQLVQLSTHPNLCLRTYTNDSLISRVRNRMFSDFVLGEASHLVTFDCDCIFTPKDFETLISHVDNPDRDVVVGAVPTKQDNPYFVYRLAKPMVQDGSLLELTHVGDFMLLSRSAAERITGKFPELEYRENKTGERRWAVFQPMVSKQPHGMEYMDETWSFSERARQAGCRLWLDTRIQLGHLGKKVYYKTK